ncbi:MAG: cupin domain-containing protein [Candidatus Nanopelagicales bacterium]
MAVPTVAPTPDSVGGSRTVPRPALARCLAIDVDDFARDYWGERPLLSPTPGFADLFSADAVDELLTEHGLRTPFLRMARDGAVLPASRFTTGGGVGARISDQADATAIHRELAAGTTLVLQGLHRTWGPLRAFARQLVADLGHPVQINAYITPPQSQGFAAHYDTHDVLVLQIAGTKTWRLHEPVVEHPDRPWETVADLVAARATEPAFLDHDLVPGECLYLPRGWLHSATAQDDLTIHLTVGIPAITTVDVLRRAVDRVRENPDLRANLPLGATATPELLAEVIAPLLKEAAHDLAELDPADVAPAVLAELARGAPPEPVAPLRQLRTVEALTATTPFRVPQGARARVTRHGDRLRLEANGRFVEAPASCADALARIATGAVTTPADLPGLDVEAAVTLVRRLLADAIVVPVD